MHQVCGCTGVLLPPARPPCAPCPPPRPRITAPPPSPTHPQALSSIQLQAQRDVAEKMISVCIARCVGAPAEGRLGDRQRRCLDGCASAWMEGYGIAAETLNAIAQKAPGQGHQ